MRLDLDLDIHFERLDPSLSRLRSFVSAPLLQVLFLSLLSCRGLKTCLETHFCESRSWSQRFRFFNDFLFVVFAGKKQRKQVGNMAEI